MKIGLLAYSTDTGLGNQTYEFYKHMKPAKTMVADLTKFNNAETHHERFPDAIITDGFPKENEIDEFITDLDLIFVCETPLNYSLFSKAETAGVKTVLQYNYEFLDYLQNPQLPKPSVLAAPTWWHKDEVEKLNIAPVIDLYVPVNDGDIEQREIKQCRTIIHVAGKQAVHDRNGTETFISAARKCGNRFNYKIYAQSLDVKTKQEIEFAQNRDKLNIELVENLENYTDIYKDGDLIVLPRKYGGLCLPMQEALAAGIPVVMPNVSPNHQRLPKQWLVDAKHAGTFMTRSEIDLYETDPNWLAFKMLEFQDAEFMHWSNKEALSIGKELSWQHAMEHYNQMFETIIK